MSKYIINKVETIAAREKQSVVQDTFKNWLWSDEARTQKLERLYNDSFNSFVRRTYDGSHLTLPGANPDIVKILRPIQKDCIFRSTQHRNILLGLPTGAGKTYTFSGAVSEWKRLGLSNKPCIVVPNHLVAQAAGNGFGYTVIDGTESSIPTLVRSYHKINCGPFVKTPYGVRMLRKSEFERIQGHRILTEHYATAIEISGQGVSTRIFAEIFKQLGHWMVTPLYLKR